MEEVRAVESTSGAPKRGDMAIYSWVLCHLQHITTHVHKKSPAGRRSPTLLCKRTPKPEQYGEFWKGKGGDWPWQIAVASECVLKVKRKDGTVFFLLVWASGLQVGAAWGQVAVSLGVPNAWLATMRGMLGWKKRVQFWWLVDALLLPKREEKGN